MARIIIVGTGGIGTAIARALHARGTDLHLVSRNAGPLEGLARELGASWQVADVRDNGQVRSALAAAGDHIDGLAYCVGSITLKPLERVSDGDVIGDFEINALGALRCIRAALPQLKASEQASSSVVVFSSVAVAQGFPSHASIAMAKGAVEGLTRSLAAELAPRIRVNAIAPSLVQTPLSSGLTANPAIAKAIAQLHPLQRLGEPADIASLAGLLLSAESGWITGQVIGVDGGRASARSKG